jgi:hypothetical protein
MPADAVSYRADAVPRGPLRTESYIAKY